MSSICSMSSLCVLGDEGCASVGGLKEPRPADRAWPKVTQLGVEEVDLPPHPTAPFTESRVAFEGRETNWVP